MYKAKKELGQNFLLNFDIAHAMVDALDLVKDDTVVEIGAGLGALTQTLSDKTIGTNIIIHAVEIDARFTEKLNTMFLENLNLNVVKSDILRWLPKFTPQGTYKILGSLPYYITSPILHSIVRHKVQPETCVLLLQKEVAQKISNKAPKASYFSTYLQTFYDAKIIEIVQRNHFNPIPKVDGAVLKLQKKTNQEISFSERLDYEEFLHHGFSKPRKMLNKIFSKDFLMSLKTDDKLRPQHISIEKWVELFRQSRSAPQQSQ
ncbi:16S rRNA (adenine(1518)-N(6)/adenine(1519)-N(6))-dimethyltransferase RsmA [Patescibacteria group bacterium]